MKVWCDNAAVMDLAMIAALSLGASAASETPGPGGGAGVDRSPLSAVRPVVVVEETSTDALAAERWRVGTAMNLPVCVREYGAPDMIDFVYHGCGHVVYPDSRTRLQEDWSFPTRVTFSYSDRGEKIVTECGSITAHEPLAEGDRWMLAGAPAIAGGER